MSAGKVVMADGAAWFAPSVSLAAGTTFDVNGFSVNGGITLSGNGVDGNGALINSSAATASFSNTASYLTFAGDLTIATTGRYSDRQFPDFFLGNERADETRPRNLEYRNPLDLPHERQERLDHQRRTIPVPRSGDLDSTATVQVNPGTTFDLNGFNDEIDLLNLNSRTVTLGGGAGTA